MKNIVVLISGNGSNLQAIIDACARKKINGSLRAVFSNKADAFGLERARAANIPAHALAASQFANREAFDRELMHEIDAYAPDLVVLAGYMRILSPAFVAHYQGRMLNIHPSLLPKYPGLHTHRQALENGDEEHGTSVHFVTDELDAVRWYCRQRCRFSLKIPKTTLPPAYRRRNTISIPWLLAGLSTAACARRATKPGLMK